MTLSTLFRCFICDGSEKEEHDVSPRPIVPVQYSSSIEGKSLQKSPADSEDSFDSEVDEKKSIRRIEVAIEEKKKNRALVVASKGTYDYADHPFPEVAHAKEVVIKNMATGLNPIDYKSVDYNFCLPEFPWITGREMAGVVEEVGDEVDGVKVGDLVWTSTYYRDRRAGCFQHFVTVPAHTVLPIPSNLSFDSAACLGVAGLTAALTLWRWLRVPMAPQPQITGKEEYLLVWGGSTVTGQFTIQIASRCGLKVIAVTSSKTQALAESLGAIAVPRNGKTDDEVVAAIREIGGDNVTRAIDLVGTKTAAFCLQALSTTKPCLFAPLAMISSKTLIPENITVETVEMKQFVLNDESRVYALELNRLVEEGAVKLPGIEVLEGGLDVVQEGLERLKKGDMAGRKMVVRMH